MQAQIPSWENDTDISPMEDTKSEVRAEDATSVASEPPQEAQTQEGTVNYDDDDAAEDEEDDFDYLAYANDRALFFFADLLALKLIDESEFPADILESIKTRILEY